MGADRVADAENPAADLGWNSHPDSGTPRLAVDAHTAVSVVGGIVHVNRRAQASAHSHLRFLETSARVLVSRSSMDSRMYYTMYMPNLSKVGLGYTLPLTRRKDVGGTS